MRARLATNAATKANEARLFNADCASPFVGSCDALHAVAKDAASDSQIAFFKANACAMGIGHAHILKNNTVDPRPLPAQHQRSFAFASFRVEYALPGNDSAKGNDARCLHGALAETSWCDKDCALRIAN
jgi:hypothetical protein